MSVPVAAVIAGALAILVVRHYEDDVNEGVRTTLEEMAAIEHVQMLLWSGKANVQSYLLSGRADFLKPHIETYGEVTLTLDKLEGLERDEPEYLGRLASLRGLLNREMGIMQDLTKGYPTPVFPDSALLTAAMDNATAMQSLTDVWVAEEQANLAARLQIARRLQVFSAVIIGGGAILGILSALMAMIVFSRLHRQVQREQEIGQAIQMSMTEGLMVIGEDGLIQSCNEAAVRLLGMAGRCIGKPLESSVRRLAENFASPSTAEDILGVVGRSVGGPVTGEISLLKPRPSDIQLVAFPIRGEYQQGLIGLIMRDITEEREVQKRQESFVYVASHELRTPMTSIMGFSELLLKYKMADDVAKESLERIYQASRRLTMILDDMLNVSRIHSGRLSADIRPLIAENVLTEVLESSRLISPKHIFAFHADAGIPMVMADKDKLTQVVTNLVDNAIKYSPRGGAITISVRHAGPRRRVVIGIADEGMGIAPSDIARLFTTFHRIHRPETETIRGTGLGLYIVKSLVSLMNGEVWVESELNKGSTFFFSLPVAE